MSEAMPAPLVVNIATPAYGSRMSVPYVTSLLRLMFEPRGDVRFSWNTIDFYDIVLARNYLISNFYFHQRNASHMLFLDEDMGFDPNMVHDMLATGQDLVGSLYARRKIDLQALHAAGARQEPYAQANARASEFIGSAIGPAPWPGFVEANVCGTGAMLISRRCIDTMIERCPDIVDEKRFKNIPMTAHFERFLTPFNKVLLDDIELSEDFSFCYRWRMLCGGRLYANTSYPVQHMGLMTFSTRYADLTGDS